MDEAAPARQTAPKFAVSSFGSLSNVGAQLRGGLASVAVGEKIRSMSEGASRLTAGVADAAERGLQAKRRPTRRVRGERGRVGMPGGVAPCEPRDRAASPPRSPPSAAGGGFTVWERRVCAVVLRPRLSACAVGAARRRRGPRGLRARRP